MSWKRAGAVALAIALVVGAFAGAYALAAADAPDGAEARQVRAEASDGTYAVAQLGAFGDGLRYGLEQGLTAGAADGEQQGRAAGQAAIDSVLASRNLGTRSREPEPIASLPGTGGGLVVGDSLEVLTSPYLKQYLPGVELTVNAEGGYNSNQIFGLFEESYDPSQSVIVFDAGTNDNPAYPEILAGNLDKVASIVGGRCLVVPTIHGFTVDGVDNTGKNRVVGSFAASHERTQVPDWARAVEQHPELMQADDLHPIPEGADYRARLIARGIRACLAMDPRFGG
ncbi:MAG: hypothetical protein KDB46_06145 [Solirubrobacterales bacterium]|nr:hypothetical protein [Solirubrobacterales bacterium]